MRESESQMMDRERTSDIALKKRETTDTQTVRLLSSRRMGRVQYDLLEWCGQGDGETWYLIRICGGEERALGCLDGMRYPRKESEALFDALCDGEGSPCLLDDILRDYRLQASLDG